MTSADVDAVTAYASREDVSRYLLNPPRDRATIAAKIEDWAPRIRLAEDDDFLMLAVERREDAAVVGHVMLKVQSIANAAVEVGWTLNPDFTGRGYATEAGRALLDVAFDRMRLHRAVAVLDPGNAASIRVCRRLGMREEARHLEDLRVKGGWGGSGLWAILAGEWGAA